MEVKYELGRQQAILPADSVTCPRDAAGRVTFVGGKTPTTNRHVQVNSRLAVRLDLALQLPPVLIAAKERWWSGGETSV